MLLNLEGRISFTVSVMTLRYFVFSRKVRKEGIILGKSSATCEGSDRRSGSETAEMRLCFERSHIEIGDLLEIAEGNVPLKLRGSPGLEDEVFRE